MSKKLNEQFGITNDDIDRLMKEADDERDSLSNLSEEELQAIQERKEKVAALKSDLKTARGMKNSDWAESIIKSSVENAVIAQHLAIADLEDDFQSKKVSSLSELTNAISSGASELVKMEQSQEHLEIAKEKNELRRLEMSGGKVLDTQGGPPIIAQGKGQDLLKLVKNGTLDDDETINKDESEIEENNE